MPPPSGIRWATPSQLPIGGGRYVVAGRTMAIVKAGLAGAFAYNRLKADVHNAEADRALQGTRAAHREYRGLEAAAPQTPRRLRQLGSDNYDDVISKVKDAGSSTGAEVKDQVLSASQLMSSS